MEGIAVEDSVAVDAGSGCVLEPQPTVDDGSQVRVDAMRAVLVEMGKGEVEHGGVAGADEVGAVALDEVVAAGRGQGQGVQGVGQVVQGEEVGGPAGDVRGLRQVLAGLDGRLGGGGEVMGALGLGEAGQVGARVGEVGQDVGEDFDGQRLEGGGWGGRWRRPWPGSVARGLLCAEPG